jgi:hypothetical protein
MYDDLTIDQRQLLPVLNDTTVWDDDRESLAEWLRKEDSNDRVQRRLTKHQPETFSLAEDIGVATDKWFVEDQPGILAAVQTASDVNGRSSWHMRIAEGMPLSQPASSSQRRSQRRRNRGDIERAMASYDGHSRADIISIRQSTGSYHTRNLLRDGLQDDLDVDESPIEWLSAIQYDRANQLDDTSYVLGDELRDLNETQQSQLETTLRTIQRGWQRQRQATTSFNHTLNGGDGHVTTKTYNETQTTPDSFAENIKTYAQRIMDWAFTNADDTNDESTTSSVAAAWNDDARTDGVGEPSLFAPIIADYHDTPRLIRNETDLDGDDLRDKQRVADAIDNDGLEPDTTTHWQPSQAYRTTVNETNLVGAAKQSVDDKARRLNKVRNLRMLGENPADHIDVTQDTLDEYDNILKDEYVARHSNKDLAGAALTAFNDKAQRRRTARRRHNDNEPIQDIADDLGVTTATVQTYL